MNREYNEDYELRRYVRQNFSHALTEREHALHAAAVLEIKARHARLPEMAARLRKMP